MFAHSTRTGWHFSIQLVARPGPSDFHLFPTMKEFLGGRCFKSNEVKNAIKQRLKTGARGLWQKHTKTYHMLWKVPECSWRLCKKITSGCNNDIVNLFLFCLFFFIDKQSLFFGWPLQISPFKIFRHKITWITQIWFQRPASQIQENLILDTKGKEKYGKFLHR